MKNSNKAITLVLVCRAFSSFPKEEEWSSFIKEMIVVTHEVRLRRAQAAIALRMHMQKREGESGFTSQPHNDVLGLLVPMLTPSR